VDDLSAAEHLEDLTLAGRLAHPLRLDNHAISDADLFHRIEPPCTPTPTCLRHPTTAIE